MKIVIGKFSNEPFHALSKKEVSLLLKLVPKEWIKPLSSVILSSKIFKKTKLTKPVEYKTTNKQLSIFSRGLERESIARQVLLELATMGMERDEANTDNTFELEIVIKPYMAKFMRARV
jgi:phage/plasmid-associated DNA primase